MPAISPKAASKPNARQAEQIERVESVVNAWLEENWDGEGTAEAPLGELVDRLVARALRFDYGAAGWARVEVKDLRNGKQVLKLTP